MRVEPRDDFGVLFFKKSVGIKKMCVCVCVIKKGVS